MNIVNFSDARASLKAMMDTVCKNHEPTVVSRVGGDHVVLVSLEDYNGMVETLHLLRSPANSARLARSLAQVRAGRTTERGMIEQEDEKQASRGRGAAVVD